MSKKQVHILCNETVYSRSKKLLQLYNSTVVIVAALIRSSSILKRNFSSKDQKLQTRLSGLFLFMARWPRMLAIDFVAEWQVYLFVVVI